MSKELDAFNRFIAISKAETAEFLSEMDFDAVKKAGDVIIAAKKNGNRVHISGIGKPSHIAGYVASLISSYIC